MVGYVTATGSLVTLLGRSTCPLLFGKCEIFEDDFPFPQVGYLSSLEGEGTPYTPENSFLDPKNEGFFPFQQVILKFHMGVSKNRGTSNWKVYNEKNPFKMDDLGVPLFSETTILIFQGDSHPGNPLPLLLSIRIGLPSRSSLLAWRASMKICNAVMRQRQCRVFLATLRWMKGWKGWSWLELDLFLGVKNGALVMVVIEVLTFLLFLERLLFLFCVF